MINVILTEPAPGTVQGLKSLLSVTDKIEVVGLPQDGLEAAQMAIQMLPDVLLVHENLPAADGYEVCRLVKMAAPEVGCILLTEGQRSSRTSEAMLAGANAIVPPMAEADAVVETIRACAGRREIRQAEAYEAVTDPTRMPVTVGLISAKDGVGKTTLAVNLAVLLAKQFPGSVVLTDMYAQLGDVSLMLNMGTPPGSLVDLAPYAEELDIQLINSHLYTHSSSLRALSGSTSPEPVPLNAISVPYLASLLGILRRNYRLTLYDLPSMLWDGGLYILSRCQLVLVVTNLFELTTIRDTNSLLRIIIDGGYVSQSNVKLLVNRATSKDRFSVSDLEEATGMKVEFTLPNDTETVISSANRGEPFILTNPRAPVSRGIAELADAIVQPTELSVTEQAA